MAIFESSSLPLNGSESEPVLVEIAPSLFGSPILIYAGFLLLGAAGSAWYIRGRRRGAEAEPAAAEALPEERAGAPTADEQGAGEPLPEEDESVSERFARLIAAGQISDAVHALYAHLAGRIATTHRIDGYLAMTPRELARRLQKTPARCTACGVCPGLRGRPLRRRETDGRGAPGAYSPLRRALRRYGA